MQTKQIRFWLALLPFLATACASAQPPAPVAMTDTPSPAVTATNCVQELVQPQLKEIQPAQPSPGSEITVLGAGGYLQDSCGGYIESARVFALYLDRESAGDLTCYVNRCEAKVTLPETLSTGSHCFSVESEECQLEFQVTAQ